MEGKWENERNEALFNYIENILLINYIFLSLKFEEMAAF